MEKLLEYLGSLQPGPVSDTAALEAVLAPCWHMFDGSEAEQMHGGKLRGRMEQVVWKPPILRFVVERHGATVLGSTRAELHHWELNVEKRTALCGPYGFRQVVPMQPRLDVRPMAEEIAQLIIDHQEDERLKWYPDGAVRVHIGKIIPADSAVPRTLEGRRRRFRKAVEELLGEAGWHTIRPNKYGPPDA
jgi:hypothetical protein